MLLFTSVFPPIDVYETDEALVVEVDLPGVNVDDVKVYLDGSKLILEGTRIKETSSSLKYYMVERYTGYFKRVIPLPFTPNSEDIKATFFRSGILVVKINKNLKTIKPE